MVCNHEVNYVFQTTNSSCPISVPKSACSLVFELQAFQVMLLEQLLMFMHSGCVF